MLSPAGMQVGSSNSTPFCVVGRATANDRYRVRDVQASEPGVSQTPIVLIGSLGRLAPGWILALPLLLSCERDQDGSVLVGDDEFLVYGVGETMLQALEDYVTSLIEYYEMVAEGAGDDPHDRIELHRLQRYLRQIPAP